MKRIDRISWGIDKLVIVSLLVAVDVLLNNGAFAFATSFWATFNLVMAAFHFYRAWKGE